MFVEVFEVVVEDGDVGFFCEFVYVFLGKWFVLRGYCEYWLFIGNVVECGCYYIGF